MTITKQAQHLRPGDKIYIPGHVTPREVTVTTTLTRVMFEGGIGDWVDVSPDHVFLIPEVETRTKLACELNLGDVFCFTNLESRPRYRVTGLHRAGNDSIDVYSDKLSRSGLYVERPAKVANVTATKRYAVEVPA